MDDWSDKKRTRDIRTNEDGRKRERSGETETHPTKRENRVITRNLNAEEKDCKELEGLIVELTATHDAEIKSILQCHQEELRGMKERCCREKEALCRELSKAYDRDIAQMEDVHNAEMEALTKISSNVVEGLKNDINTLRWDTGELSMTIRNVINEVNVTSTKLMKKLGRYEEQLLHNRDSRNGTALSPLNETTRTINTNVSL